MSYIVEKDWESSSLRCVVIAVDRGYRCGYVGIPKEHILFGIDYNDVVPDTLREKLEEVKNGPTGKRGIIDLFTFDEEKPRVGILFDVHGGITYSGSDKKYPVASDLWWFGYDCHHPGDTTDENLMSAEYKEIEARYSTYFHGGVHRTLDYCIQECESLARQLKEISI